MFSTVLILTAHLKKKKKIFEVVHHTHATNIEDLCNKNILIPFLAFFFSHKLVSQKSNLVTLLVPDIFHGSLGEGEWGVLM